MARTPENSTSRSALVAAANLLALVDAAIGSDQNLTASEALDRVTGVLRNIKGLRDYQVDELLDFLAARLHGQVPHFVPDQSDPDVGRKARHQAAVDDLVAAGQTTIEDLDPREAADVLAERVRGGTAHLEAVGEPDDE